MGNSGVVQKLCEACATEKGFLTIVKVGNLISLVDKYGEAEEERIQGECVRIIDSSTEACDVKGYIGDDEFVIFYKDMENERGLKEVYSYIDRKVTELIRRYMDEKKKMTVSISMGAVMVPEFGTDYTELFDKANHALEETSDASKIVFYDYTDARDDLVGAMCLDYEKYITVRDFMNHFNDTYQSVGSELVFTFEPANEYIDIVEVEEGVKKAFDVILKTLRISDVMTVSDANIRTLLPEINMPNTISVINRIKDRLKKKGLDSVLSVNITSRMIGPDREYPIWLKAVIK